MISITTKELENEIDLKMNKLKAENVGQMNMYLNYYENVINSEDDGKPIGIS